MLFEYFLTFFLTIGKTILNGTFEAFLFASYGICSSIAFGYRSLRILLGKEVIVWGYTNDDYRNGKFQPIKYTFFQCFKKFIGFGIMGAVASFILLALCTFWYGVGQIFKF
jgi:hypothetical protein